MLNWVEHEKSFITSGPALRKKSNLCLPCLQNHSYAEVKGHLGILYRSGIGASLYRRATDGWYPNIFLRHSTTKGKVLPKTGPDLSAVNGTLKFKWFTRKNTAIFYWKKCEKLLQRKSFSHFFSKNISLDFGVLETTNPSLTTWLS